MGNINLLQWTCHLKSLSEYKKKSKDEFNAILDDFAGVDNINWAKILACPSSPSLPEYDDNFFAELDTVEFCDDEEMQAGPSKLIAHPHTTMAVQEMPFQIMEDKFDAILDDFADFVSSDWAKILACPSSPSLPEYNDQFLLSWMLWNFAPMRRCKQAHQGSLHALTSSWLCKVCLPHC